MQISEEMIQQICSDTMYKRGVEYFQEGRVHLRKRDEHGISAVIDDDRLYNVQITLTENHVKDYFCTCPYYQTMQSPCKHIVAALKQRQAELDKGESYIDDNDKIASELCSGFSSLQSPRQFLNLSFSLHIDTKKSLHYGMSLNIGKNEPAQLSDIELFLEAYFTGESFRLSKHETYSRSTHTFGEIQTEILDILAENLENKSSAFYTKALIQTSFGSYTARRLFPLLAYTGFDFFLNGVHYTDFRIKEENPDILVDIAAMDAEINLSVSDTGTALTPDGEWFFYEGDIYHTDPGFRSWYMPLYHVLVRDLRTQIQFKGSNTVAFASVVLPALKSRHGVTMQGISSLIIEDTPKFEVYFDKHQKGICAAVKAIYGTVAVRLPDDSAKREKIIIRDYDAENDVLSCFSDFYHENGLYILHTDETIYDFIERILPRLQKLAKLYYSDAFKTIHITTSADIRARVNYHTDNGLLEMDFETTLSYEEMKGILRAVQLNKRFYRLQDGRFLKLAENDAVSVFTLMDKIGFDDRDILQKSKALSRYDTLYLESVSQRGIIETDEAFDAFIQKIKNIRADIPPYLEDILRSYQKDGVHWFKQLSEMGFGGILADDMGLGKTLQVIAFICGETMSTPALIITPSALTYNWKNEIARFAPDKRVLIIDGVREERIQKISSLADYDFVITSYPLLRRDISLYDELYFEYLFIDEAQYIKNPSTMNAHAVKKLNAGHRFALTGTPIENSLTEIWSIFDFVMKGYLYSYREFLNRFEHRIGKEDEAAAIHELRDKIKPFILRRMKNDVLTELPEKIENTMLAELTPEQKQLYASYLTMAKNEALSIMSDESSGGGQLRILSLLMRLRQICCHPKLFDNAYKKDSGKLILLEELVTSAVESGHRLLIFSQFTSMLRIIRERLDKLSIPCFYLDGSTPSDERLRLSERFNLEEVPVFLISLKAGGTGLNLTGADMVVHYDPWWNPAVMDQASDRAHRIGQKNAVQIIKLAAQGTIEEKIIRLQDKKRLLADGVIQANKAMLSKLTKEEILALFE